MIDHAMIDTRDIAHSLAALFSELTDGASLEEGQAFMLNPGDVGLLRSLDALSAEAASRRSLGGAPIAAHVDHLRYGLSLMNRWASGENPFTDADWSASWKKRAVTDAEWADLRAALRDESRRWRDALDDRRDVDDAGLKAMVGSIAHLAYHLGAIRQIDAATRGPTAA
jgi:hypothetical protein